MLNCSLYGALAAEVNQYPVSASKLLEVSENALKTIEVEDAKNFIAITTDNPTVIQAFQRKFKEKFYWTFPCFLHGLNTIIGEISTRVITFFNGLHYWGGQLKEEAQKQKITLILQAISVKEHRQPLMMIYIRPDAKKKTDGLLPVGSDVTNIVIHDVDFWPAIDQLIKTMSHLTLDTSDNSGFWMHAKQFMVATALSITKQWRWSEVKAKALIYNLKEYQKCTGVFAGDQCLLKALAVILHSIIPYAANVERYFSGLRGTQSAKCYNLTVETFKVLSKLYSAYAHHLYKMDHHAHMHMQLYIGIDIELSPSLVAEHGEDDLAGPEAIIDDELTVVFDMINCKGAAMVCDIDPDLDINGNEVLEGQVYSWDELEAVNKGTKPTNFIEDISIADNAVDAESHWDVREVLSLKGITSLL
ncbi:hypothetical protein F5I97DRAFT_1939696 [Phlebopus sp. FC_14]|nr:hypothetical protein F5I97DRAFT_1939696 [Phlebopus sp. FC_14]